jgi:hypothetical protein
MPPSRQFTKTATNQDVTNYSLEANNIIPPQQHSFSARGCSCTTLLAGAIADGWTAKLNEKTRCAHQNVGFLDWAKRHI